MKRLFPFAVAVALLTDTVLLASETNPVVSVPPPVQFPAAVEVSNSIPVTNAATAAAVVAPPEVRAPAQLVISPGGGLNGKVVKVDKRGRFVVLNFPLGQMPAVDSALDVYRNGVKVGEIKITGPQRDDNTVADVVSGELQAGDVARNR